MGVSNLHQIPQNHDKARVELVKKLSEAKSSIFIQKFNQFQTQLADQGIPG